MLLVLVIHLLSSSGLCLSSAKFLGFLHESCLSFAWRVAHEVLSAEQNMLNTRGDLSSSFEEVTKLVNTTLDEEAGKDDRPEYIVVPM